MIFKATDLDLSNFPGKAKWPNGVNAKEGGFGLLLVSKTNSLEEYHRVIHNYNLVSACDCKHHTEGYKVCKHMEAGQFILNQRQTRFKKPAPPVIAKPAIKNVTPDPVTARMEKASLNGSRGFSLTR